MKTIELNHGRGTCLVDDEDYEMLVEHDWRLMGRGYASTKIGTKTVLMHRLLLGIVDAGRHIQADHINNNKIDNRRSNLRTCTNAENHRNMAKSRRVTTSRFKGVRKEVKVRSTDWAATIRHFGKTYQLGRFKTETEAALAYNDAALKYFGEFALLNDINSDGGRNVPMGLHMADAMQPCMN